MERIELPLAVLETAALPLYYTGINFDTLLPMCVSKHSKLLRLPVRKECFDTLDFYQLRCRHSLLILEAAYIIAVFSVSAGSRSLCHIMKNPGVFSSGVLGRYTNIV